MNVVLFLRLLLLCLTVVVSLFTLSNVQVVPLFIINNKLLNNNNEKRDFFNRNKALVQLFHGKTSMAMVLRKPELHISFIQTTPTTHWLMNKVYCHQEKQITYQIRKKMLTIINKNKNKNSLMKLLLLFRDSKSSIVHHCTRI